MYVVQVHFMANVFVDFFSLTVIYFGQKVDHLTSFGLALDDEHLVLVLCSEPVNSGNNF